MKTKINSDVNAAGSFFINFQVTSSMCVCVCVYRENIN